MSLKVGIVGLPNVGKSTLFNALLRKQAAFAANFPFATVEPNVGIVPVPDKRLAEIARVVKTEKIVPATVEFVDIAGLVKGASKGEGLGNKFLAHIREVSVICHVVRDFKDGNVVQTGSGDFLDDYTTIETELILADLETLMKQKEPRGKVERMDGFRWSAVQKLIESLEKGIAARDVALSDEEKEAAGELMLMTAKREIVVLNLSEDEITRGESRAKAIVETLVKAGIKISAEDVISICAKMEEDLAAFDDTERLAYLKEAGLSQTGLERLIDLSYRKLGLISFLTGGEIEARAWTIEKGAKAPQAAGVIHTDFEKKFIKAKVCDYDDFIALDGWKRAAEMGKVRVEGKEYEMRDGDVVEFMIGS